MSASRVPHSLSPTEFQRLREYFLDTKYTEEGLKGAIGTTIPPHKLFRNFPRLLYLTREIDPLRMLIRLFFLGIREGTATIHDVLPSDVVAILLKANLINENDGVFERRFQIVPFVETLVVSDMLPQGRADTDIVLGNSPSALRLLRSTMRTKVKSAMDLGTGNGIQSLLLGMHCESVVATDLNPRAIEFAKFNTCLNGLSNVECVTGKSFEPVEGRTFDLIVANPPFFLTPSSKYLFSDNDQELDDFCRGLFRAAPAHLNEGGFFQAIFEWVNVKGQTWEERLRGWFEGIGCDVWVLRNYSDPPEQYGEHKLLDTFTATDDEDLATYNHWMEFYERKQVERMHGGYLVMRKRSGENWLSFDETPVNISKSFSDKIAEDFRCRDYLVEHPRDDQLLETRFSAGDGAVLTQELKIIDGEWKLDRLRLGLADDLKQPLGIDGKVGTLVELCDGKRTLREAIEQIASRLSIPFDEAAPECLRGARVLIGHRFILPEGDSD